MSNETTFLHKGFKIALDVIATLNKKEKINEKDLYEIIYSQLSLEESIFWVIYRGNNIKHLELYLNRKL